MFALFEHFSHSMHFHPEHFIAIIYSDYISNVTAQFFRFAIELNEILESERLFLPKTDTRFRSDQKALEVRKNSLKKHKNASFGFY